MADTLNSLPVARPEPTQGCPQHLCLDKGYDAPRSLAEERGFTLHLRTRGEEIEAKRHAQTHIGAKARRWVVEAAHAWTNRFRDLLNRWAKKPANNLALTHFAFGIMAWRRCLPG